MFGTLYLIKTGDAAGAEDLGDDKWAIKRPRGTNPAIERGDLEAIAACRSRRSLRGPAQPLSCTATSELPVPVSPSRAVPCPLACMARSGDWVVHGFI